MLHPNPRLDAQHSAARDASSVDLKRLQAASGVVVALFVIVHLANTALAVFGADAYNEFQGVLRRGYQQALVEVLLLSAIVVHAIVGVMRIASEPKRTLTTRARWHRIAGIFLMAAMVGHIGAVRGASFFFDVYPGFEGLSFTLNAWSAYFYPYYLLLALAGFYHLANGLPVALRRLGANRRLADLISLRTRPISVLTAAVAVVMLLALLALGGQLFEIADPFDNPFARLATRLLDA